MHSCIWECLAQLCGNDQSSILRKAARPFPDLKKKKKSEKVNQEVKLHKS